MTRKELESRRLAAVSLIKFGLSQGEIARKYGVSGTTAMRWFHAFRDGGEQGLRLRSPTGRPPRITLEQLAEVKWIVNANPRWNYREVGDWITRMYGIVFHHDHVGKLLKRLGFPRRPRGKKAAK